MFIVLLAVTFAIAVIVSFLVVRLFRESIATILDRIVAEDISGAWWRYLTFAIFVVGVSGGVRVWDLEKYITPRPEEAEAILLNAERWTLEVYRTVIGTLQSIAWMLLVFFVFALIAYVIVRGLEARHPTPPADK
jgi:ABC-type transport system involved in multi-copper enzyme maturation permease subunit